MNRNGWSDAQLMQVMANAVVCFDKENHRQTRKNMIDAGFIQLGAGAFGAAFWRPDMEGYVIKVSDGSDAFAAYCYWAMANQMPCVPEYKYPMFSEPDTREYGGNRRQFMVMMPRYSGCVDELHNSRDYAKCQEVLWGQFDSGYDLAATFEPDSDLQRATLALYKFFGRDVGYDFHAGNLLWDGLTKRFIITDPICNGDTDVLVKRITGKSMVQKAQDWEQVELNLAASNQRVWPRPAYADRVDKVQVDAGLRDHAAIDDKRRDWMMPKLREREQIKAMPFEPHDWEAFGERLEKMMPMQAKIPDAIGRAADWVRRHGLPPDKARKIGSMAGNWSTQKLINGPAEVLFNFAPEIMPMFVAKDQDVPPDRLLPIELFAVPVDVVKVLRDQWRIDQDNKARRGWRNPQFKLDGVRNGLV